MPISLSFSLTICAAMWLMYGLSVEDFYVAVSIHIYINEFLNPLKADLYA